MNVFKVQGNPTLEAKYKGTGYALAATVAGQLVDIVYLRDALPEFEGDHTEDGDGDDLAMQAINDLRIGPTVRKLQALGQVHVGMLSCWEFVEL